MTGVPHGGCAHPGDVGSGGNEWLHTPQDRQTVVAVTAAMSGCTHRKTDRLWWHLQRQWVAAHTARQTDRLVAVTAAVGGCTHRKTDRLWWQLQRQ